LAAHLGGFGGGLVALAEEVEDAVDDHAMELLLERHAEPDGVLPYPVDTDHDVARDKTTRDIVEGDDIGIGVVVEVLPIDAEEVLVVAKKIVDVANLLSATHDDLGDPTLDSFGVGQVEIHSLRGEAD
jgi:hypothetical protein